MKIVISSDPKLLHILRGVVRFRAEEAGFGPSESEGLAMAVDEAASNVIRHTYANRRDARLALEIQVYPDRMEFALEDSGPKVRAEAVRPRALDDVRPGGLGTYFINCFMDVNAYDESFTEGNRLRLVKYLHKKATPQHEGSGSKRG